MANLNQCNFIGNAGGAPEIRTFQDGGKLATVNIAVTERYKGRDGSLQENTQWVPLVFSDMLAELAEKLIARGTSLYVTAKYSRRYYTNAEGVKKQVVEFRVRDFQLLGSRLAAAPAETAAPAPAPVAKPAPASDGSDDLPFD